jgi:cell division protease FtsH
MIDLIESPHEQIAELLDRSRYRGEPVGWDEIVGHEKAKRELRVVAEQFRRSTVTEGLGLTLVKGVAIFGPPGTGKTMLAKALASAVDRPAYVLPSAEMTPTTLRLVYEALADQPCVVIWDEVQSLISRYDDKKLAAAFCAALDGVQPSNGPITVAMTAEGEFALDRSALRAGRLTTKVTILEPDRDERRRLWEVAVAPVPVTGSLDLDRIADESEGFTGADISATVTVALGLAMVDGHDALTSAVLDEAIGRDHHVTETPEPPEWPTDQWAEAVHEAGHAIWAAQAFGRSAVAEVQLFRQGYAGGHTRLEEAALGRRDRRASIRAAVRFTYAGLVAEELLLGDDDSTVGGRDDVGRATDLLREMIGRSAATAAFGPLSANELEDGLRSDRGSDAMRELLWLTVRAEAETSLAAVRADLVPLMARIESFARALHDAPERTLSGDELARALQIPE